MHLSKPTQNWLLSIARIYVLLLTVTSAIGQTSRVGSIAGTITETWHGKPLADATVRLKGYTQAVRTDTEGKFRLDGVEPGEHTVQVSAPGYNSATVSQVLVLPDQVTTVNLGLSPQFYEMDEYVVDASELEQQETALVIERQTAAALIESISSDRFNRLAAGDAAEIVTKITGVTVVEGKFAVIRGLSDRYNVALLNGAYVPSADPYRRAAQLDMFPAEVIDAIVVNKTFMPDLPGGFSGGAVDIRTKSFPEKFAFKIGGGLGFNSQATFNKNFLTYPGGDADWLAIDDGTRKLPDKLKNIDGSQLQKLAQAATSGSLAIPLSEKQKAAETLDDLTRSFGSPHMGPTRDAPPLDHDFDFLVGDTLKLGSTPIGYFAGLSYERDYRFYEDGIRRRYVPAPSRSTPIMYQDYNDNRSTKTVQWSAIANLATRLFDHHTLDYNFLFTQNAEDVARQLFGRIQSSGEDQFQDERRTHLNELHWTERNLMSHQFRGKHVLPELNDLQTDWLVSFANTTQDEPDLRYFNFISYPDPHSTNSNLRGVDLISNNTPFPDKPTRYFRNLEDDVLNSRLDFTIPFNDPRELTWKAKAGLFFTESDRTFVERTFSYSGGTGSLVDPETFPYEYMTGTNAPPPELVVTGNRSRYRFSRTLTSTFGNNFYIGSQDIYAGYGLLEVPVLERLKLAGGVRYETTLLQVDSSAFGSSQTYRGIIDEAGFLPAVSLTYELRKGMNARLSYSQTVARPTYREFARYRSFDVAGDQIVEGNPSLKLTHIENYDARWEWFMSDGGMVSIGSFFKLLEDPIEKFNATLSPNGEVLWTASGDFVTFLNTPKATAWGVELEARHNLAFIHSDLSPFSVGFNFAWIDTEVELQAAIQELKYQATGKRVSVRSLYDQSPYVLNADITYENKRTGTSVTLAFNYAAERLALIINNGWDVYEQAAPRLDLVMSQRLGKGFKIKFTAQNLLNPEIIRSYAVRNPTDTRYLYSSHTQGVTFGLSLSYEY